MMAMERYEGRVGMKGSMTFEAERIFICMLSFISVLVSSLFIWYC